MQPPGCPVRVVGKSNTIGFRGPVRKRARPESARIPEGHFFRSFHPDGRIEGSLLSSVELIPVVWATSTLSLQAAPPTLFLETTFFSASGGSGGFAWRGAIEGGLDELAKPRERSLAISLATPMSVGMNDEDSLTRQPGAQMRHDPRPCILRKPLGITQIPAQGDPSARRVHVLAPGTAGATRQLDDFGCGNTISTDQRMVR
jgi:hypothetical protein